MWGQGYATESMEAIIAHVRTGRTVKQIQAEHAVDNPASGRVMRKLGMEPCGTGSYTKADGSAVFQSICYRRIYEE